MKKSCISLMLCIALICFGGCGKGKSEDWTGSSVWNSGSSFCMMDEGVLYNSHGEDGKLFFYDYETGTSMPLCARANCEHTSNDCMAVSLFGRVDFIGRLGDRWYYHTTGDSQYEGTFYQCDLNGENEKPIGDFPYTSGTTGDTVSVFYEHYCVTVGEDLFFDEKTGKWEGTVSGIYRFDLKNGKTEALTEEKEYAIPAYAVYGLWENSLIYSEWNGEKRMIKRMDLDTKKQEVLLEDNDVLTGKLQGQTLLCSVEDGLIILDLETGKKEEIETNGVAVDCFWDDQLKTFIIYGEEPETDENGYTIYPAQIYQYLDGGDVHLLKSSYEDFVFPFARVEDTLIGRTVRSGKPEPITQEDFLKVLP